MNETQPDRVRLGVYELNVRAGELRSGDQSIVLQEQPLQILLMLIERDGEVVTREEIQKRLWPNDTVVEFDHSINSAIRKLRRALDDPAEQPIYIETVARRGYRLLVPVEPVDDDEPVAPEKGDSVAKEDQESPAATKAIPVKNPLEPNALGAAPETSVLIGKKVSHYRVLKVIAGGGMGMVYKAEDLKLGRQVALKFLPEELAWDPLALRRFEREARTASLLDHPNICTIYEVEEYEGQPFLVMQLLQGETLRDRLSALAAENKSLPLDQMLDIAIQICEGLQAAHDKGIIHRDIKPANIFLNNNRQVKILDFGLAKLVTSATELGSDNWRLDVTNPGRGGPTLTADAPADATLTRLGAALGTAGYMSPEQVRGEALDARTDIFSFGLTLYEMATGQRAFTGDSAPTVQAAILHTIPSPPHELNRAVPRELEDIINKALEKDREQRYQSATEMGADLKRLPRQNGGLVTEQPARYGRLVLFATVLILVLLAAGFGFRWFKDQRSTGIRPLTEEQLTHNSWENRITGGAISPDGKNLAYLDEQGLHLRVFDSGEIHDVPLPRELQGHLSEVSWFPDGERLLLTSGRHTGEHVIWSTSIFGGNPRPLATNSNWPRPAVSPQGTQIAYVSADEHEIWIMGAEGENPRRLVNTQQDRFGSVTWSPTGRRLAYTRSTGLTGGNIETVPLDGGPASVVAFEVRLASTLGSHLQWLPDGRLIYVAYEVRPLLGQNLWAMMVDPVSGKPSGGPTKLTHWDNLFVASPAVDAQGTRLTVTKMHLRSDVFVAELEDQGRRLTTPTRLTVSETMNYPSGWMSDGKTLIFASDHTGKRQIFRQAIDQAAPQQLMAESASQQDAELSPDGRWLLYWSTSRTPGAEGVIRRLMRLPVAGGMAEEVLQVQRKDFAFFDCPIRPSASCVFIRWDNGDSIFYELDPIHGVGKEIARTKLGTTPDLYWSVSPEGSRMAVEGHEQGADRQVRILDLRTGAARNLMLPHEWHTTSLSWAADGNSLLATGDKPGNVIARIDLDGKLTVLLQRGPNETLGYLAPSPDGRRVAFSSEIRESNVWLLENF